MHDTALRDSRPSRLSARNSRGGSLAARFGALLGALLGALFGALFGGLVARLAQLFVVALLLVPGCATEPDPGAGDATEVEGKTDQASARSALELHVSHLGKVRDRITALAASVDDGDLSPAEFWFLVGPVREANDRDVARLARALDEGEISEEAGAHAISFGRELSASFVRYEASFSDGKLSWPDVSFLVGAWADRIDAELALLGQEG